MNNENSNKSNIRGAFLKYGILALVLLIALCATISVRAWFYSGRRVVTISEISNPTIISINAGNAEDVRYIDLGRIDVSASDEQGQYYKDFVFCVTGINITWYKLQLAYTTNNQFSYEIYKAELWDGVGDMPPSSVLYTVNVGSDTVIPGTAQYYYKTIEPGKTKPAPISGSIKNLDTSVTDEILALTGDEYYDKTYGNESGNYNIRHKNAVPLYWQSNETLEGNTSNFCNYYILRVIWTAESKNDKETDIIYISARNTTPVVNIP